MKNVIVIYYYFRHPFVPYIHTVSQRLFFFFAGMPDDGVRHQNVFTKFPYTRLLNYPTDVTKVGLTGYNC